MRVCVIGTGYVGLVTGACLAHIGHHVICIDNNADKVALMQSGQSPIFEPGLAEIMQAAMQAGNLEFTTDLGAGVAHGEILFIAVGTPALPTGESDTRYVEAVARAHGLSGVKVESDVTQLADGCDALVVITEWQSFLKLDYAELGERMTSKIIIDGRNFLNPEVLTASGFQYIGIGRPTYKDITSTSSVGAELLPVG